MTEPISGDRNKHFPCPSCGNNMEFDPQAGSLKCHACGNCGTMPDGAATQIQESDFAAALREINNSAETVDIITVTCDNCGATLQFDPNITADRCIYCASSINAANLSTRQLKPQYLLPFKLTNDEATANFRLWLNGRWFLPGTVKTQAAMEKIKGVYSPFWTYDSGTTTQYSGSRGDYYYVQETYTEKDANGKLVTKTRQVRHTRWTPASGTVSLSFNDLLCLGSKSLPRSYTEALEPWDLDNLVPFSPEYTSGFRAECYSIDLEQGFADAREQMQDPIHSAIIDDIGGDEQRIDSKHTSYYSITFKYIQLPIWISAFQFKKKVYRFVVNARTGEVQGERPWSVIKITLFALMLVIIAVAIVLAVKYYSK